MQWAMYVGASHKVTAPDRSNKGPAWQDAAHRPGWAARPAYLPLCGLRSYPHAQLRRLCSALSSRRTLPLAHAAVRVFVEQTLFHLGTLVESARQEGLPAGPTTQLAWRTGWLQPGDVAETLCHELAARAEELEETPREHEAVLLLGEAAA